jgi:hypothetical protein
MWFACFSIGRTRLIARRRNGNSRGRHLSWFKRRLRSNDRRRSASTHLLGQRHPREESDGAQIPPADYDKAIFFHEVLAVFLVRRGANSGLECPVNEERIGFLEGIRNSRCCQCPAGYRTAHRATFVTSRKRTIWQSASYTARSGVDLSCIRTTLSTRKLL